MLEQTGYGTIDRERLQEAMDRPKEIGCLTSRDGWYRLKEAMTYQLPEE